MSRCHSLRKSNGWHWKEGRCGTYREGIQHEHQRAVVGRHDPRERRGAVREQHGQRTGCGVEEDVSLAFCDGERRREECRREAQRRRD